MRDGWAPNADGYVNGRVGVFPTYKGSWDVWTNLTGSWRPVDPPLTAAPDATLEEAMKLADDWFSGRPGIGRRSEAARKAALRRWHPPR